MKSTEKQRVQWFKVGGLLGNRAMLDVDVLCRGETFLVNCPVNLYNNNY